MGLKTQYLAYFPVNQRFASIERLEDAQFARFVALLAHLGLFCSAILFIGCRAG